MANPAKVACSPKAFVGEGRSLTVAEAERLIDTMPRGLAGAVQRAQRLGMTFPNARSSLRGVARRQKLAGIKRSAR